MYISTFVSFLLHTPHTTPVLIIPQGVMPYFLKVLESSAAKLGEKGTDHWAIHAQINGFHDKSEVGPNIFMSLQIFLR